MIWILSKLRVNCVENSFTLNQDKEVLIPSWTPFNKIISVDNQPVPVIRHCSVLPYAPTSHDAVYTAMKNFSTLNELCGKKYCVLTAEMSIYLIGKLIQMQPTNPFPNLWLRIGPFHLQKIIIEILGQYLSGCGIEEIIVHDLELYVMVKTHTRQF